MKVTDTQKSIIHWKEGNLLVTAAAGSGKTFVFVSRIAYLIRVHKVDPEKILALTFTRNAAEEMRKRLTKLVGKQLASKVTMSTFHSFAYAQLERFYPQRYLNRPIIADWFKLRILYDIAGENTVENPNGHNLVMKPTEFANFVSYQKSHMIRDEEAVIIDENTPYCAGDNRSVLQSAYETYCSLVRTSKTIEFDDMIMDFAIALEQDKDFLEEMLQKFNYIMVDEFQDTNNINSFILQKLNQNNLMVVGDVNQSIYSFINADIEMILNFEKSFSNVKVIKLEHNYRSSNNIIKIANDIVMASKNENFKKYAKQTCARQDIPNHDIVLTTYQTELDEIINISRQIKEMKNCDGVELSNIAIISRTNATLGMFESQLTQYNIPIKTSNGKSFFDRKEVSDLLSYAQYVTNPNDDMSLRKIINIPNRFISKKKLTDLDFYAYEKDLSLFEAMKEFQGFGGSRHSIQQLISLFEELKDNVDINAEKFLRLIYNKTRYNKHIEKISKNTNILLSRQESVKKLFQISRKFKNIKEFLNHVYLAKDNSCRSHENAVNLMTVHAAKGLEFKHVFGVSINDESYPHSMSYNYEEERRLLYVLVSRASEYLYLSSFVFKNNSTTTQPSPFLIDSYGDKIVRARKDVLYGAEFSKTTLIDKS